MKTTMFTFEMMAAISIMFPEGYTVNSRTFEPITAGYAVAVADTQNSFGNAGMAKVAAYISKHPEINAIGGWYNSENKQYYFDATIVVNDLQEAIRLGKANKQIAIFDLNNMQEIRL